MCALDKFQISAACVHAREMRLVLTKCTYVPKSARAGNYITTNFWRCIATNQVRENALAVKKALGANLIIRNKLNAPPPVKNRLHCFKVARSVNLQLWRYFIARLTN